MADLPVQSVAPDLGMERRGRRWSPCPACGAAGKRRGPIWHKGTRWACTACQVKGDALSLVSWVLHGHGRPRGKEFAAVLRWVETRTTVDVEAAEPLPSKRPPPDGVRAALAASRPLPEATHYQLDRFLSDRGLDRSAPAFILRSGWSRRVWWPYPFTRHWPLIVPCYTGSGTLVSIHGRALSDDPPRKTTWPRDTDADGLLFASGTGLDLLRNQTPVRVLLITEGIMDYLSASIRAPDGCAVIGVTSGSAAALRLLRLASTTLVVCATDDDAQGEIYAQRIAESLAPHPVRRAPWRHVAP